MIRRIKHLHKDFVFETKDVFDRIENELMEREYAAREKLRGGRRYGGNAYVLLGSAIFGLLNDFSGPEVICAACKHRITLSRKRLSTIDHKPQLRYFGTPKYCPQCGYAGGIFREDKEQGSGV